MSPVYPDRDPVWDRRPGSELRPHFVYELWLDDTCVYVGMTNNLQRRVGEHRKGRMTFKEVRSTTVSSRLSAEGLETRLIAILRPRYNLRWNPNYDRSLIPRGGFFKTLHDAAHP